MNGSSLSKRPVRIAGAVSLFALLLSPLAAQRQAQAPKGPWMDASLAPDQRADMVLEQMTLDEKIWCMAPVDSEPPGRARTAGPA